MAHATEQLVGRVADLEVLEGSLAGLERRRSRAVELLGEPGIGKTRMLAELGRRADARGHIVLSGSASELERELPFSVFVDALDDYVQALEPRRLDMLDDDVRAELAQVLPSFPRGAEIAATLLRITRSELSERTAAIVTRLARPQPRPEPRRRCGVPRGLGALRAA